MVVVDLLPAISDDRIAAALAHLAGIDAENDTGSSAAQRAVDVGVLPASFAKQDCLGGAVADVAKCQPAVFEEDAASLGIVKLCRAAAVVVADIVGRAQGCSALVVESGKLPADVGDRPIVGRAAETGHRAGHQRLVGAPERRDSILEGNVFCSQLVAECRFFDVGKNHGGPSPQRHAVSLHASGGIGCPARR